MFKLSLSLFFSFAALSTVAQMPVLNWVKGFEENNVWNPSIYSNGRTVGVDDLGNVYSAGLFSYSVDFDPGPGVYTMVGGSPSQYGIFISKLDANGNFVWVGQVPTLVEFGQIELKVDGAGNVYLASDLRNPADMDPGPGVLMMSPTGFRDAFVIKLNTNGELVWAKQFGGPGDTGPQSTMLELDRAGNIIIGGTFNNTVDFDPGPGVFNLTSPGHIKSFLVKLSNNGDLVWARIFGYSPQSSHFAGITDIKCDAQNNIFLTGTFAGTIDFDPGTGTYNQSISAGGAGDGYICKLDADCNFSWVKTFGQHGSNNHHMRPYGIDIDGEGNIITAGFFIGDFDFDPRPGVHIIYSNPYDCFILKLNRQGEFVWVKVIGNALDSDTGNDVVVDAANNIYTIGSFGKVVDFDPGPGTHVITSPEYDVPVLVKLSATGDFTYAAPFQSLSYGMGLFRRMAIDPVRNIYVSGYVAGSNDFDPGPGVYPFDVGYAPFVLKLSPCLNVTTSTLNVTSCDAYTLNNQTYTTAGTYVQTIPNSSGCDSVITLHLSFGKKSMEQTKIICDGETFFAGGQNQNTTGTYYDTLQTSAGCDSVVITHLTVNPNPSPNLGPDQALCRNTQLTLTPGNHTTYAWQDNSTQSTFIARNVGTYWVRVTNSFNCVAADTIKITGIMEPPANFLKEKDSVCGYEDIELAASQPYSSYLWSTGGTGRSIYVRNAGSYRLQVTDANGCTGTDTIAVLTKQCLNGVYIPTAFTPNNDGRNDFFKPIVYGTLLNYTIDVYDRAGQRVFSTSNPVLGWKGDVLGIIQPSGVYVWQCRYQLAGQAPGYQKGTVMLIR